jgi:hypothetical protein
MQLGKEEVDFIQQFVKSKGYTSLEVKHEMVDHLACRVEEEREKGNTASIEKIIRDYHASFGIFGFSDWEQGIIKQVRRKVFLSLYGLALDVLSGKGMLMVLLVALTGWVWSQYALGQEWSSGMFFRLHFMGFYFFSCVLFFIRFKRNVGDLFSFQQSLTLGTVAGLFLFMQMMADGWGIYLKYQAEQGAENLPLWFGFGLGWLTFGFLVWNRALDRSLEQFKNYPLT